MALPCVDGSRLLKPWSVITGFENVAKYVTPRLAYVVAIERGNAKFGGRKNVAPFALRATMILRPEEGT
jgi:hypothetical protein